MKKIYEQFFNTAILKKIPDVEYFIESMLENIDEKKFEAKLPDIINSARQQKNSFTLDSKNKNMTISLTFLNIPINRSKDSNLICSNEFSFVYNAKKKVKFASVNDYVYITFSDLTKKCNNNILLSYRLQNTGKVELSKTESDIDRDVDTLINYIEDEMDKIYIEQGAIC